MNWKRRWKLGENLAPTTKSAVTTATEIVTETVIGVIETVGAMIVIVVVVIATGIEGTSLVFQNYCILMLHHITKGLSNLLVVTRSSRST